MLEQQNIRSQFNTSYSYSSAVNAAATSQVVPVYLCPSTSRLTNDRDGNFTGNLPLTPGAMRACSDYGGMFRYGRCALPYANGVMLYDRSVRQSEIVDGLSHTIIIAEDTGRGDAVEMANGPMVRTLSIRSNGINRIPKSNEIWSDHIGRPLAGADVRRQRSASSMHSVAPTAQIPLCTRRDSDADNLIE